MDNLFMDILNKLFDRYGEEFALGGCEWPLVACEVLYSLRSLGLLEFAVNR